MKNIILLTGMLCCHLFFAQTARTISFEQPTWPDASTGQFEILSATFTDGLYKFTASDKIFINGNAASTGSQSFWPTNFANGESFIIETTDGSEFDFVSVQFIVFSDDSGILNAEGFKNGSSTGVQSSGVGFGTSIGPTGTKTVTFDNAIFDDVDKVVITSTSSGFGWSLNLFDDFVFANANVLGVHSEKDLEEVVKIHPNPVHTLLHLSANNIEVQEVELFDVLGKSVKVFKYTNRPLDFFNINSGVYILKIKTPQGISFRRIIRR